MEAIVVDKVSKYYRKYSNRHRFQTLKSAIVKANIFKELSAEEKFLALDNVSFQVKEGETFGIIGSNGAGKSTLLKLVAGTSRPTEGTIEVNGRLSALIELGAGFHPEISGRENIYINGIMLGLSKKEISRKYDDIVRFAELEDFIESPVKTYSTGMYLRLGFAVAIHVDPDVLLIDEVISVGDQAFSQKCVDKFNEFRWRNKSVLLVTHALGMVVQLCDRALWLENGRIQSMGDPQKVVDDYLTFVSNKEEAVLSQAHGMMEEEAAQPEEESQVQRGKSSFKASRWGNRTVEITDVKLIDSNGKEKHIFQTGESMEIQMTVRANERVKDFVFGIGLFNSEGVCCYGSNTHIEQFKPQKFYGEGTVRIKIKRLNLIAGTYYLDVAIHKKDGFPYDYHRHLYTLRVKSSIADVGIFRPEHSWHFSPNIVIKK